ncbi:MAG: hypothetical protein A3A86_05145 [Elusimicrobia bacterium RIFCSPLOWO2_01_FULL_60_11]|nr:MAG: hypothetical protein A3A86_05145 [Elusimicrobia bacterium RIFCSPLOWO2_01_FULL_60_11]
MKLLFSVESPLGKQIRTTEAYWHDIVTYKHPQLEGKVRDVELTLIDPDVIRKSRSDKDVYLYYKAIAGKILCAVARHLNGEGFLITAYFTSKVKEGKKIWERKK